MTREDACAIVRRLDGKFPWSYLGKPLEAILDPLELTVGDFIELCDRYTNKELFVLDSKGDLKKDRRGNLIKKYDAEDACR